MDQRWREYPFQFAPQAWHFIVERPDRGSSPVCRTCGGIGQADAAVAAMLADAARFSYEAIAADMDVWERQREAQRDAMPATLATAF